MTRTLKATAVLLASLWVGGLFWIGFVVAFYLFGLAARGSGPVPNTGVAADLIGPLLNGTHLVGLIVPAALIAGLSMLRSRNVVPALGGIFASEVALGVAFLCAAANYLYLTPRVTSVKGQITAQYGAFHLADKADPLYGTFEILHHTSTGLFTLAFVAGLVCLICLAQFRTRASK